MNLPDVPHPGSLPEEELSSWFNDRPMPASTDQTVEAVASTDQTVEAVASIDQTVEPVERVVETEEYARRQQRLIKNRISAKASREKVNKRLAMCATLEDRCIQFERQVSQLNFYIHLLQQDNLRLKAKIGVMERSHESDEKET